MQIKVKFLPPVREYIGQESITLDLPAGTTVSQVLDAVRAQFSAPSDLLNNLLYMVNYHRAQPDTVLQEGDEVICFKLLGGG